VEARGALRDYLQNQLVRLFEPVTYRSILVEVLFVGPG
jgi:hypothetical protein